MEEVNFTQVVRRGCGIDIHRDIAVATIGGEGITTETRSYKTFSSSLTELKEWLIENGVTHVAMEEWSRDNGRHRRGISSLYSSQQGGDIPCM